MNSSNKARTRKRHPGFTLVEMVVVISIMCVLIGMTSMIVAGLQTPGSRNGAMLQITQALEETRMNAIEQGTKVYIGFADASHPDEEKRLRSHLLFREYTADEIAAMPEPPPPHSYKPLTEWALLPQGFFLDNDAPDSLPGDPAVKLDVQGLPGDPTSVYAIAFGPLGQVSHPSSPLLPLVIVPAQFVDSTSGTLVKTARSDAGAFTIQINRLTGRVKNKDGLPEPVSAPE